jgi:hypothetical protein
VPVGTHVKRAAGDENHPVDFGLTRRGFLKKQVHFPPSLAGTAAVTTGPRGKAELPVGHNLGEDRQETAR